MDHTDHLASLLEQGGQLAAMPPDALDAPVPAVPGWTLEHVVRHTGKVHRWVTAMLADGPHADPAEVSTRVESLPHGPDCLEAYAHALTAVHEALRAMDPQAPAASFIGPVTAGFWHRRQAHEVTVHRIDAADAVHAAGGPAPTPVPPALAADGVDEWARVFVATRWSQRFGDFPAELDGRRVALRCTDTGSALELAFDHGQARVVTGSGTADVELRAAAEPLLLTLWRRRPVETIEVSGDRALAERLLSLATF